jgi:hypothetical protein
MSRRPKPGQGLGTGPPQEPWFWLTRTIVASRLYQALGVSARRILDFLMCEHASHGGKENGNLCAPYNQLETFGVTPADISKGFAELIAAGFVVRTKAGLRQAGGGDPSRYRVTFYVAKLGFETNPSCLNKWTRIQDRLVAQGLNVRGMRIWLKVEVKRMGVGGCRVQKRSLSKSS